MYFSVLLCILACYYVLFRKENKNQDWSAEIRIHVLRRLKAWE